MNPLRFCHREWPLPLVGLVVAAFVACSDDETPRDPAGTAGQAGSPSSQGGSPSAGGANGGSGNDAGAGAGEAGSNSDAGGSGDVSAGNGGEGGGPSVDGGVGGASGADQGGGKGGSSGSGGSPSAPKHIPCDIALTLQEYCHACHNEPPVAGAPFALITYSDVASHASAMYAQVQSNNMPPVGPPLPSDERATLLEWLAAGAPSGEPCP